MSEQAPPAEEQAATSEEKAAISEEKASASEEQAAASEEKASPPKEEGEGGAARRLTLVPTDPGASGADPGAGERHAVFRIVRGEPDDAELAALTVVLAAAASAPTAEPDTRTGRSVWVDRAAMLRRPLYPGPGAWRTSTWPR